MVFVPKTDFQVSLTFERLALILKETAMVRILYGSHQVNLLIKAWKNLVFKIA
jgi:hypothetical protein